MDITTEKERYGRLSLVTLGNGLWKTGPEGDDLQKIPKCADQCRLYRSGQVGVNNATGTPGEDHPECS